MTGGYLFSFNDDAYLDSTEIFVNEKVGWISNKKYSLPHPMRYLSGISINNKIFMIGKKLKAKI